MALECSGYTIRRELYHQKWGTFGHLINAIFLHSSDGIAILPASAVFSDLGKTIRIKDKQMMGWNFRYWFWLCAATQIRLFHGKFWRCLCDYIKISSQFFKRKFLVTMKLSIVINSVHYNCRFFHPRFLNSNTNNLWRFFTLKWVI